MSDKPSKFYTLPDSPYHFEDTEPIVINFDHINMVKRIGKFLFINKTIGYIHVQYKDTFEIDLLVRDINNKWEAYKQSV